MTLAGTPRKKEPKYLKDITISIDPDNACRNDFLDTGLFLGRYDKDHMMRLFERVGITKILHEKGYKDLILSIHRHDDYTSRLYVNSGSLEKEARIIELIVREGVFRPTRTFVDGYDFDGGLSMMLIEWLALQDPMIEFSKEKPRLPGQAYPGLGGLKNMQGLLYRLGRSLGKDAIVDIPEYFHAAAIYSRMYTKIYSRKYSFFSPIDAGQVKAMIRDLKDRPLSDVSFAIAFDCLVDEKTSEMVHWRPSEQVYPITKRLYAYIEDKRYKDMVEEVSGSLSFAIDWGKYARLRSEGVMDDV